MELSIKELLGKITMTAMSVKNHYSSKSKITVLLDNGLEIIDNFARFRLSRIWKKQTTVLPIVDTNARPLFDALTNPANFYTGLNIMEDNTDTEPVNENQSTMNRKTSQTSERTSNGNKSDNTRWIRLNHKGIYHDNRRLLKHRAKNCECFVCYREIYKLPPAETNEEYLSSLKAKMKEREIKKSKRLAKKDVKAGKQATIEGYFQVG